MAGRKKMTATEAAKVQPGQFLVWGPKNTEFIHYTHYDNISKRVGIKWMNVEGETGSLEGYLTIADLVCSFQISPGGHRMRVATQAEVAAFEKKVMARQTKVIARHTKKIKEFFGTVK